MPRSLHHLLVVLLLTTGCSELVAQRKGDTRVLLRRDRLAAQWDTVDCVKNILKVNPLLFLRGEVPLYFEHALNHKLSLELAAGVTNRSFIDLGSDGNDLDAFDAGTRIIPKFTYQIGLRYYLADDIEPQGTYLQFSFAHLDFTKDITLKDSSGHFTDRKMRDQRIYNDLRLLLGWQRLAGTSNWLIDVYGGLAFRVRDREMVREEVDLLTRRWSYHLEEDRDQVPAFFLGVKVGLGF